MTFVYPAVWMNGCRVSIVRCFPSIRKTFLCKILIPQFLRRQSEENAAVGADDFFAVFVAATDIFQIAAASDRFHDREHDNHYFGANALSVRIDGTAAGVGIGVSDFLAVPVIPFRTVTPQKPGYLDFEFILPHRTTFFMATLHVDDLLFASPFG
jgi:hypothetical protein